MKEKSTTIKINLLFLIRRLEEFIYQEVNYEIEQKIRCIELKVYEIGNLLEEMEILLE